MELGAPDNFTVFCSDTGASDRVDLTAQHGTGDDLCRWSGGTNSGRDDYVGIENN